jgi:hypothetical protein
MNANSNSRSTISNSRYVAWAALLFALPLVTACSSEHRFPVHPVSGKISYKGEAPVGAQIVLHPQGGSLPSDVSATGTVKSGGNFKIGVYEESDGAPAGDYVATIQWFKVVPQAEGGGGAAGPNVIPAKYARPDTSPLKFTVKSGANEIPAIDITE